MDPSEKDAGYTVTLAIPDITRLADEALALFAPFRDGRWSAQTKALLAQFSATKLDLNRGWTSTACILRIGRAARQSGPSQQTGRPAILNAHCGMVIMPQRTPRIIEWRQNLTKISFQ